MIDFCLSLEYSVWLAAILNSFKRNIVLWTNFNQCRVYIYEKKNSEWKTALKILLFIEWVMSSSSSSCRAPTTDILDPLLPLLPIVHRFWQVFRATSRILTELLYVCSSWSSCFCSAICGGPLEYISYELVPTSPAVSCMSGSSNLDSFRDGRQVAV